MNHENFLAGMRQIHVFALFMPVIEVMGSVAVALVIWHGGGQAVSGRISLGALVAFISYIRMMFRPIRDIAEKYNILQNAMSSAERIFLLLDTRRAVPRGTLALPENRIDEISLENIGFFLCIGRAGAHGREPFPPQGEKTGRGGPHRRGKNHPDPSHHRALSPGFRPHPRQRPGPDKNKPRGPSGQNRPGGPGPGDLHRHVGGKHPPGGPARTNPGH